VKRRTPACSARAARAAHTAAVERGRRWPPAVVGFHGRPVVPTDGPALCGDAVTRGPGPVSRPHGESGRPPGGSPGRSPSRSSPTPTRRTAGSSPSSSPSSPTPRPGSWRRTAGARRRRAGPPRPSTSSGASSPTSACCSTRRRKCSGRAGPGGPAADPRYAASATPEADRQAGFPPFPTRRLAPGARRRKTGPQMPQDRSGRRPPCDGPRDSGPRGVAAVAAAEVPCRIA
jgi:hypothetical protein